MLAEGPACHPAGCGISEGFGARVGSVQGADFRNGLLQDVL